MILRHDPDDLAAALAGLSEEECAARGAARAAPLAYDIAPEEEERLRRGAIQPGERFTILLNGEPIEATFGGPVYCD